MSAAKSEIHVKIALLQKEVQSHLGLDSSNVIFDFEDVNNKIRLDLVTVNPVHRQAFLFHTTTGKDKVGALQKMLDYLTNYEKEENSYTIQWSLKRDSELQTSYFRSTNIMEALEKFYYGRDPKSIVIFSVILNPIA